MTKRRADELMRKLQSDPDCVAKGEERERERRRSVDEYNAAVADIVDDLAERGFEVTTPSELRNLGEPYERAVPVLLRHLKRDQNLRVREDIVAALAHPCARGEAAFTLLELLLCEDVGRENIRFRMADTLCIIADASLVEELEALAET